MTDGLELAQIRKAIVDRQDLIAVHYSCESFLAKDHPPAISAIAIYDLRNSTVNCFSRSDAPPSAQGEAELHLLREFYQALSSHSDALILHWNMDRPEFGFDALVKRYRYLADGNEQAPTNPSASRLFDVDELIATHFGQHNYAPHGKLESTAKLNDLDMRSFMPGKDEADRFKDEDWGSLIRSTSSKAKIIGQLCEYLVAGTLRTAYSAGMVSFASASLDAVATVLDIGNRYLLVRRSLGKHPHGRDPLKFENEWDDQYVFRSLLSLFFEDIRDEDPVQTTAGSGSRIDFVLPDFALGIELKHTRPTLKDEELGQELATDVARYKSRSDITHLLCLVFDYNGNVRNPRALEKDLSRSNSDPGLTVTVKIYDR